MANEITASVTLTVNNPSNGSGFIATIRQTAQFTQNALGVNAEIVSVPTALTTYAFTNLTTYGWMFIQNLDATNYVDYGLSGVALAAPVQSAPTTATTGGTLAANTYYYVVTALTLGGETVASNEKSITTTGSTSKNTISWASVTGATGYNIYRGTTVGGENVMYTVGVVTSFLDTGAAGTAATPPASNTTSFQPFGRVKAGEYAVLRLTPAIVFAMKAHTAAVEVNYQLFND